MQLLDRINLGYDSLTKKQKRIADYVLRHYREVASMPAAVLSEKTGVSLSTVVRFAYSLGCSGYPALVKELQNDLHAKLTSVERLNMVSGLGSDDVLKASFQTDVNNLRVTAAQNSPVLIDAVIHAMNTARRLYLVGSRSSRPLIEFLDYYLHYMMDNVHMVRCDGPDLYSQTLGADRRDCIVAISFPRYARTTMDVLENVRSSGATIVAITDRYTSPPALLSDYTLTAKSYTNSFVDSFVAPLALINVLIVKLGLRRHAELFANFERLEELWQQQEVYALSDRGDARH